MPTGYTSVIGEKNNVKFREYALRCARGFGALVEMRDESMEVKIPKKFTPHPYYKQELEKATKKLEEITTIDNHAIELRIEKEYDEALRNYVQSLQETAKLVGKYVGMREESKKWQPPTKDHKGLKDFMVSQLESSINHDCDVSYREIPKKPTVTEYKAKVVDSAKHDVEYHQKEWDSEIKRANERTEWVKQLYASLNPKKVEVAKHKTSKIVKRKKK